jgi:hypothetical protein
MDLATFRETYAPHGTVELVYFQMMQSLFTLLTMFARYSRARLNFFTNRKDNQTDQIFIFFSDELSVSVKAMRKFVF